MKYLMQALQGFTTMNELTCVLSILWMLFISGGVMLTLSSALSSALFPHRDLYGKDIRPWIAIPMDLLAIVGLVFFVLFHTGAAYETESVAESFRIAAVNGTYIEQYQDKKGSQFLVYVKTESDSYTPIQVKNIEIIYKEDCTDPYMDVWLHTKKLLFLETYTARATIYLPKEEK